ncbi:hypothetical protein PC119_g13091 [Phytophthora cactorum]|nr:hypothetical protein PC114_g5039 [Phytophthora cactorum]KAG3011786.1 hypothetical protein PC119_g13091 [Phytophthora cactorum]KAG3019849.1 hypothetical protein PC120_g9640 [Phytophthora cactorum]KAG3186865.1 hypothetical protein PC128_g12828 [Phytophthora cactorum]
MTYRIMDNSGLLDGINFFDTAEIYGGGLSEKNAIKKGIDEGVWRREDLVVTGVLPRGAGTLTGKYSAGVPEDSRYNTKKFGLNGTFFALRWLMQSIADELGSSPAQMALAWIVSNDNVSTVLVGGNRPIQLEENLKALSFVVKMAPEIKAKIDAIVNFVPTKYTMAQFAYVQDASLTSAPKSIHRQRQTG